MLFHVAMMKERLNGRATKTLIGLGRQLAKNNDKDDVTFLQLQLALRQFHIGITPEVYYDHIIYSIHTHAHTYEHRHMHGYSIPWF